MNDMAETEARRILTDAVKKCFLDSGGLDSKSNILFDREINASDQYAIELTPVITINDEKYSGNMKCPNPGYTATCPLFAALCAAISPEPIPLACWKLRDPGCPRGENRDRCGVCGGDGRSCKYHIPKVIIVILIFTALIITLQFACGVYLQIQLRRTQAIIFRNPARYQLVDVSEYNNHAHSDSSTL